MTAMTQAWPCVFIIFSFFRIIGVQVALMRAAFFR